MEVIKCKYIDGIVFLLCLLFFALTYSSFGQIERVTYNDSKLNRNVVTRYSSKSINIESSLSSKENISINVKSDSLDNENITFLLYAYFPLNINPEGASIVLFYNDGTNEILQQVYIDKSDNYTEYAPVLGINNIATKKVNKIVIRGIAEYSNKDKEYFIDFLSYL